MARGLNGLVSTKLFCKYWQAEVGRGFQETPAVLGLGDEKNPFCNGVFVHTRGAASRVLGSESQHRLCPGDVRLSSPCLCRPVTSCGWWVSGCWRMVSAESCACLRRLQFPAEAVTVSLLWNHERPPPLPDAPPRPAPLGQVPDTTGTGAERLPVFCCRQTSMAKQVLSEKL